MSLITDSINTLLGKPPQKAVTVDELETQIETTQADVDAMISEKGEIEAWLIEAWGAPEIPERQNRLTVLSSTIRAGETRVKQLETQRHDLVMEAKLDQFRALVEDEKRLRLDVLHKNKVQFEADQAAARAKNEKVAAQAAYAAQQKAARYLEGELQQANYRTQVRAIRQEVEGGHADTNTDED